MPTIITMGGSSLRSENWKIVMEIRYGRRWQQRDKHVRDMVSCGLLKVDNFPCLMKNGTLPKSFQRFRRIICIFGDDVDLSVEM